jgi:DNA-binding CsgD family transcriptional regulator
MTEQVAGRSIEQRNLLHVLDGPSWRVVTGSPGSGKTSLIQWVLAQAEARSIRTLLVRPVQIEASIAHSALSDVISRATPEELERIDLVHRTVLDQLVNGVFVDGPALVRSAFSALLRSCAAGGSLLLVLDDAHWIDRESAETIAFACRRMMREHSVVAAFRVNEPSLLLDALAGDPMCSSLALGRLDVADIATIIGQQSDRLTPSLCLSLAEFADGNPLRAREIGRASLRGAEALFKNRNIRVQNNPLGSAAELLTAEQLDVLYVASQLRDARLATLNAVFSVELVGAVLADVGDADHVMVLDRQVQFEHPLFADAVAAVMTPSRQRELHGRIAAAIDDPIERGRHLSLSSTHFDTAMRIEIFVAATLAAANGSLALALQLAFRAIEGLDQPERLDHSDDSSMYIDSQRFVAQLEFRIDDVGAAAARLRALESQLVDDARQIRVSLDLANLLSWSTSLSSGVELYEDILRRPDATDAEKAEAAMQLAFLDVNVRTADRAIRVLVDGQAAGDRAGGQIAAETRSMNLMARFVGGHGIDRSALAELERSEDLEGWLTVQCAPFSLRPFMLAWCEDESALEAFAIRRQIFRRRGSITAQLTAIPFETNMLCSRGRIAEARALVQLGIDTAEFDNPLTKSCSHLAEGRLHAHLGQWEEAERSLTAANTVFGVFGLRQGLIESASVKVHMLVTSGDFGAAIALGKLWMERLEDFAMDEPMLIPGILDLIEAAATKQDAELMAVLQARLAAAACDDRPDIDTARVWAEALWLVSTRDDPAKAKSLLEGLVKEWAERGRTTWVARAHVVLGRLARRDGARRAAADHFACARTEFESAEMHAWASVVEGEVSRSHRAPATTNSLTKAEADVARHAAGGSSNKEIAQLMFTTERTVEAHLNSVYRKLGIARRTQLHAALD